MRGTSGMYFIKAHLQDLVTSSRPLLLIPSHWDQISVYDSWQDTNVEFITAMEVDNFESQQLIDYILKH